jgi:hypothetical protein
MLGPEGMLEFLRRVAYHVPESGFVVVDLFRFNAEPTVSQRPLGHLVSWPYRPPNRTSIHRFPQDVPTNGPDHS